MFLKIKVVVDLSEPDLDPAFKTVLGTVVKIVTVRGFFSVKGFLPLGSWKGRYECISSREACRDTRTTVASG
jgi:hypothetical protein